MKLKRLIVPGVVAGLIAVALTMPSGADDGVITTTVTPLVLSVSVDQDQIDYGSLEFSTAQQRVSAERGPINVTNNSSVTADLRIKGDDATPTTTTHSTWILNCDPATTGTVAVDQYVHRFAAGNETFAGNAPALCKTTTKLLFEDVTGNGQGVIDFDLQWSMPMENPTGGYSPRNSTVTVIAVMPNTVP